MSAKDQFEAEVVSSVKNALKDMGAADIEFGLEFDPTLVRVCYVASSFFFAGFPGLLLYIILMIIMPQKETME